MLKVDSDVKFHFFNATLNVENYFQLKSEVEKSAISHRNLHRISDRTPRHYTQSDKARVYLWRPARLPERGAMVVLKVECAKRAK